MKIVKKTTYTILAIALFTAIPVIVFTLLTSKTAKLYGIQSFVVMSGSMQPTLPVGSVIYTKAQNGYNKGDIVAFQTGDLTVTHRIVNTISGRFETKGDANNTKDSKPLLQKNILGKEEFFIPYLGYAIIFFKTPLGFFGGVVFPITVFIVFEIWNLKKEIEKEVEKKILKRMQTV